MFICSYLSFPYTHPQPFSPHPNKLDERRGGAERIVLGREVPLSLWTEGSVKDKRRAKIHDTALYTGAYTRIDTYIHTYSHSETFGVTTAEFWTRLAVALNPDYLKSLLLNVDQRQVYL